MNIQQLIHYLYRPDADIFEASLLLAKRSDPALDIERYLHILHAWSVELRESMPTSGDITQRIGALNRFLFEDKGFHADHDDFYNPDNSRIDKVIDRRKGIPVSMSIIYVALGQRVGVDLQGVSFPGHFLVKVVVEEGVFVLDPYHYGVSLSEEQLERLLKHAAPDASMSMLAEFLEAASPEETVMRLMRSLKTIYRQRNNHEEALEILNTMLAIDPNQPDERRERGLLLHQLGCHGSALADLKRYLSSVSGCNDTTSDIEELIHQLETEKAILH